MDKKNVLALLALAASVAACGNGETGGEVSGEAAPEQSAAATDEWDKEAYAGCDLVSDDEIRSALAEDVVSKEEGGFYGCRWTTDSYRVGLRVFPDTSLPAGSCDEEQSGMPYGQSAKGRTQAVGEVGDTAVWGSSGDLLVCTAGGLLAVDMESTGSMTQDVQKQAAILIAGSALSRLAPVTAQQK